MNIIQKIGSAIGSFFGGIVEQGANLLGLGDSLRNSLGLKQDDELIQLQADIERIRHNRSSKIEKIQDLIDLLNTYNIAVPGVAMQALAKTKQNLQNKNIKLREEDSVLRLYEDQVINKADKSKISVSELASKGMKQINEEINKEKEKLNGLQQKFQEEKLQ